MEIEALRKIRNEQLRSVHDLNPGFSFQGLVGEFIGVYIQSEVFARKLQDYYRKDKKKDKNVELRIDVLKAGIKHFKLSFPEDHIDLLFRGGNGTKGKKSARQLRNGYLHNLSPEDKKEINKTASSFLPKLEAFLSLKL